MTFTDIVKYSCMSEPTSTVRPVILLVDDNPHDVVLIRLAFRKVGIIDTIHLVKDGTEAVRYIKGHGQYADRTQFPPPTLILLDLKMPQTNGFEVLRWIREQRMLDNLVVVVMSGSKEDTDIKRAYALGANSYLVKPSRFEDLVRLMESLKQYCGRKHKNGQGKITTKIELSTTSLPQVPAKMFSVRDDAAQTALAV